LGRAETLEKGCTREIGEKIPLTARWDLEDLWGKKEKGTLANRRKKLGSERRDPAAQKKAS